MGVEPLLPPAGRHSRDLAWLREVRGAGGGDHTGGGLYQFHRAHTTFNPFRPETASALVTSGVFAWTRNPMYLGLSLLLFGWAIKLGTLSPFAGPLLFLPLIQYVQIRPEEQALQRRFGGDYERYCQGVNRWWGRNRRA